MRIVGFMGEKGHGKNAAADALIADGFHSVAFADPIKAICKIVFGLTDEEMEDRVLKEAPIKRWPSLSPRVIYQTIGTDLFRTWLGEVWVKKLERTLDELEAAGETAVVIPDVRFHNEAALVRRRKGKVIKIVDPRKPHGVDTHIAERTHEEIRPDWTIYNEHTLGDLHQAVRMVLR